MCSDISNRFFSGNNVSVRAYSKYTGTAAAIASSSAIQISCFTAASNANMLVPFKNRNKIQQNSITPILFLLITFSIPPLTPAFTQIQCNRPRQTSKKSQRQGAPTKAVHRHAERGATLQENGLNKFYGIVPITSLENLCRFRFATFIDSLRFNVNFCANSFFPIEYIR